MDTTQQPFKVTTEDRRIVGRVLMDLHRDLYRKLQAAADAGDVTTCDILHGQMGKINDIFTLLDGESLQ